MTAADFEHFKTILVERESLLNFYLDSLSAEGAIEADKVRGLLGEIRGALTRIEHRTFGICQVCKEEVEYHRLEVQPIREICLGCITPEEQARLEEELAIAARIHRALLPQQVETIPGFDFAVKSLAASSVGGDYYDFLRDETGTVTKVVIADSMGKGIPAGLLMSNLQGAIRVLAQEHRSPSLLVSKLNWWLCRNVPINKFISLACLDLDAKSGATTLRYANAGHCPIIRVRADGFREYFVATGTVLGVHEEFSYDERVVQISAGDLLVMYTDGVTEAADANEDMFGDERLARFCVANRAKPVGVFLDELVREIRRFTGNDSFDDDLTVIAIKKKP
ncbi:MAG: SpoIIE family protein phosphatase [Candidatus Zixiibacteriota bacterium]